MGNKRKAKFPLATAAELHARVLKWLARKRERPFFLFVQSFDVHDPYAPPPPFLGRFSKSVKRPPLTLSSIPRRMKPERYKQRLQDAAVYDDAVAYADHELGNLIESLSELGLRDSTALVITSDHGEALGERGLFLHGQSLHEEEVRIPLIISLPWQPSAARSEDVISLMDLGPTLLDLAGIAIPDQFQGQSFLQPPEAHRPRIAIGNRKLNEWFLREGPWKLVVWKKRVELFHIPSDRHEAHDLSEQSPIVLAYLYRLLWENSLAVRDTGYQQRSIDYGLDEKQRKQLHDSLRALGYTE